MMGEKHKHCRPILSESCAFAAPRTTTPFTFVQRKLPSRQSLLTFDGALKTLLCTCDKLKCSAEFSRQGTAQRDHDVTAAWFDEHTGASAKKRMVTVKL